MDVWRFWPTARISCALPSLRALPLVPGLAVLDEEGSLAGYVSWQYVRWGPNRASRCPMIGIGLLPAARGRGIGRAAQRALAELFFTHTAVNRVQAHTDVDNIAEQRALEAAGFAREGLIRGAQWRDAAFRDGYLYAIIRSDMATHGAAGNS